MHQGNVVLLLVYEPTLESVGPVPLARVSDDLLAKAVAESAIAAADSRARQIAAKDDFLGEIERAEARRLRELLQVFVPGLRRPKKPNSTQPLM